MSRRIVQLIALAMACAPTLLAQGRGGAEWTTSHGDAQKTGWVRTDIRLTKDSVASGTFQLLWKMKLENETKQLNSLLTPIHLDRLVGFRGFKSYAFVPSSAGTVYAIDDDLSRMVWKTHINYSAILPEPGSSWMCPGGLTATPTRPTTLAPPAAPTPGGAGRAQGRGSGVGEPGRGAVTLYQPQQQRGGGGGAAGQARAGGAGAGGAGLPGAPGGGGGGGGRGGPIVPGTADAVYTVSNDGIVHALNVSNGSDLFPPVQFLPENTMPAGLTLIDGILYAVVANGCGTTPNGVWAIDLTSQTKPIVSWKTNGGNVAGFVGPTFGADGTVYVAIGAGDATGSPSYSNSIVALDPKTLKVKTAFTQANADFNSAPVVFNYKDQELIAATGNDGKMYVLASKSMTTPVAVTTAFGAATSSAGSLAAYQDLQGGSWVFAATAGPLQSATRFPAANGAVTNGAIVAFKVADVEGKPALQPAWTSRDLTSPLAPIVVNGVLFAASSGEFRTNDARMTAAQRAQRSRPAVLYAIDPATGKDIWSSGTAITSFARRGLSSHNSQVFVVTYDNTIYTFGIPIEK